MYKNVLAGIPGIEYYPIIALVLFFGFFIGLIAWYIMVDKHRLQSIALMAIQDDHTVDQQHASSGRS